MQAEGASPADALHVVDLLKIGSVIRLDEVDPTRRVKDARPLVSILELLSHLGDVDLCVAGQQANLGAGTRLRLQQAVHVV
jgi:hypothetical protein